MKLHLGGKGFKLKLNSMLPEESFPAMQCGVIADALVLPIAAVSLTIAPLLLIHTWTHRAALALSIWAEAPH